jgi:hypothetical protein
VAASLSGSARITAASARSPRPRWCRRWRRSKLAGERRFLMVGESKLVSYNNLSAMVAAGVSFIA